MEYTEIVDIFRKIAEMLELKDENIFKIRAYQRAADSLEALGDKLTGLVEKGELTSLPGIGRDLAEKIKEMVSTGRLEYYEELKKSIPEGLLKMHKVPGLGAKTIKLFYNKLNIDSIDKLEEAARSGELKKLEGIKEKTEENILRGIRIIKEGAERTPLYYALNIADNFIAGLKRIKAVDRIEAAGSLRRRKETIGDIDILVSSQNPDKVMDTFVGLPFIREVIAKGQTKSSVITKDNIQVDLRVVDENNFGAALVYFTGSKEFNIKLRQLAIKQGYKINEYGVFPVKGKGKEKSLVNSREKSVFDLLKMEYIPPELREDRGEIPAALNKKLPKLIELKDIRGDLHVHSEYSDGRGSIAEIAQLAKDIGYEFIGISDHSQGLKIAGGLSVEELKEKIKEVEKVNKKIKGIRVLCGAEVDILKDGSLDYPDSILKELDYVIAAIHSGFKQSKEQLTKRIVSACKNKHVNIIAHPTGVLWGQREPYELDFSQVYKVAADHKVALEINCHTQRLDLDGLKAFAAKQEGVKIFLGTDSHEPASIKFMELGVSVARRGWLEKKDVINCFSENELIEWVKK